MSYTPDQALDDYYVIEQTNGNSEEVAASERLEAFLLSLKVPATPDVCAGCTLHNASADMCSVVDHEDRPKLLRSGTLLVCPDEMPVSGGEVLRFRVGGAQ